VNQNYYLLKKLAEEYRQGLLREAQQQRLLKNLPREEFRRARHVAVPVGILLVVLGTRLKRLERSARPVPSA
jgi:hypothetical protein